MCVDCANLNVVIVEQLDFDTGLVKTAKHTVMYRKTKGAGWVPPEMDKIESWCKQQGFWKEMVEIEKDVKQKLAAQQVADTQAAATKAAGSKGA